MIWGFGYEQSIRRKGYFNMKNKSDNESNILKKARTTRHNM